MTAGQFITIVLAVAAIVCTLIDLPPVVPIALLAGAVVASKMVA